MFLGEYEHSLDDKSRVTLPRKFRDAFEDGGVIAKAMDRCLALYPLDEFEAVAAKARELSTRGKRERDSARNFFAGAQDFTLDKQGRLAVPPKLRGYAGLTKDVTIAGVFSRVEIWDTTRWSERTAEVDETFAQAEDLPEFGI